jgi:hypothetical protein
MIIDDYDADSYALPEPGDYLLRDGRHRGRGDHHNGSGTFGAIVINISLYVVRQSGQVDLESQDIETVPQNISNKFVELCNLRNYSTITFPHFA